MNRAAHLARRLIAVEEKRDRRRLARPYRLTDGRTVRLSTLDMLRAFGDGLALDGQLPPEPPPVVRDMAQLPPDSSTVGASMRAVAVEWCAAYDEGRRVVLHTAEGGDAQ
ncbi:hypothetical protein [Streptomyces atacamensis]|uniref:hypothetical protein n=1 Tax=Streptomyces atacamensis TaxID=531966 RepID=UPI00399CD4AB